MNYIWAIVAPHRFGGWEAWSVFSPVKIETGLFPTKDEAKAAFSKALKDRSHTLIHAITGWSHETASQRQQRTRLGESISEGKCQIRWFDPAKHFTHIDTAFVYDGGKPTDNIATFLKYNEDGTAYVMLQNGLEIFNMDVNNLKPLNIHKAW